MSRQMRGVWTKPLRSSAVSYRPSALSDQGAKVAHFRVIVLGLIGILWGAHPAPWSCFGMHALNCGCAWGVHVLHCGCALGCTSCTPVAMLWGALPALWPCMAAGPSLSPGSVPLHPRTSGHPSPSLFPVCPCLCVSPSVLLFLSLCLCVCLSVSLSPSSPCPLL